MRAWFGVVAVVALVAACKGSNDHPAVDGAGDLGGGSGGTGGTGGAGGTGGTGGTGGAGGTGGSGGSAGVDGASDRAPPDAARDGGGTGGSDGTGGADGSSGSDGGDGGTIRHCGGIAGLTCSALEWCDFPGDTCGSGDQQGDCTPRDRSLTDCGGVVCGCDGKTYPNACDAHLHGVDTTSTKGCIRGNGAVGAPCGQDGDCQSGLRCCRSGGPVGSPLACTATGGAGCPALP